MSFWRGKKVLVTGHTGFKGSWLSFWLTSLGAEVTGYALAPETEPSLFELLGLKKRMHSIIADVRDDKKLLETIREYQPEIILHLAAQPLVRKSYQHPVETYQTNIMGAVNLLEAVRQTASIKAVINVTTDKCYENDEGRHAYQEDNKLGGYDPYSSSKACAELVTSAYRNSFFSENQKVGIATARAGNVIGGGDWSLNRLIPDCIMNFIHHKPVLIRYPNSVRPWQHVLESLSGYLLLAEKLYQDPTKYSEAWNFGPETNEIAQVKDVTQYLGRHWGEQCEWQEESSVLHEAAFLMIDSSKAKKQLGWQPRWSVYEALDAVIEWYSAWHAGKDIVELTLNQIKKYQEGKS